MSSEQLERQAGPAGAIPAIRVRDISKCYFVYASPRDRLKQFILPRLRRLVGARPKDYYREFWAVRNVSLEIGRGQTVGIIGRNGSGKSTLLQMICGTLHPTTGSVETSGRVAALLELGSGFNPEFTGRENVYLNGAVLGLSREEIDARFDRILDFADIGEFIDQPVKTYSSGMFVRLAFAVISHVDPEILVIDEALSVGDAFFQSKCAAAMRALMDRGTTILFVSHDTHSVKALCDRALLLEGGVVVAEGDAAEVVERYYASRVGSSKAQEEALATAGPDEPRTLEDYAGEIAAFQAKAGFQRINNGLVKFLNVRLLDASGRDVAVVEHGEAVTLRMVVEANASIATLGLAYHIRDMKGVELVYSDSAIEGSRHLTLLEPGQRWIVDWKFNVALRDGEYNFSAMASIPVDLIAGEVHVCDFIPYALQFRVARGGRFPLYAAVHWPNELTMKRVE